MTGLSPGAGYDVALTRSGENVEVTITLGAQHQADEGGVLVITA